MTVTLVPRVSQTVTDSYSENDRYLTTHKAVFICYSDERGGIENIFEFLHLKREQNQSPLPSRGFSDLQAGSLDQGARPCWTALCLLLQEKRGLRVRIWKYYKWLVTTTATLLMTRDLLTIHQWHFEKLLHNPRWSPTVPHSFLSEDPEGKRWAFGSAWHLDVIWRVIKGLVIQTSRID